MTPEQIKSFVYNEVKRGLSNKTVKEAEEKAQKEKLQRMKVENAISVAETELKKILGTISKLVEETDEDTIKVFDWSDTSTKEGLMLGTVVGSHIKHLVESAGFVAIQEGHISKEDKMTLPISVYMVFR